MCSSQTLWSGIFLVDESDDEEKGYDVLNILFVKSSFDLVLRKLLQVPVTIGFLEKSKRNKSTFNWTEEGRETTL